MSVTCLLFFLMGNRLSLRPLCHFLSALPLPVRGPSENLEEEVVHPDGQLPLLLRIHNSECHTKMMFWSVKCPSASRCGTVVSVCVYVSTELSWSEQSDCEGVSATKWSLFILTSNFLFKDTLNEYCPVSKSSPEDIYEFAGAITNSQIITNNTFWNLRMKHKLGSKS